MQRNRFVLAILGVAVVALCAGPVAADEAKAPDPMKVLKSVTKNLVKEARKEGYRATLNVEGGISKAADHSLWNTTVREAYEGDIRGNVMHVPGMQVFRTSQKGAVFDGTQWAALQARADGKKLDRLFAFPVQLLSKGLKNPKKVTWLESTEEPEEVIEEEEDRGLTSVAKRQTLTREQMYHRLRVEIPDKEALQYFVEVQNSGCLSGGWGVSEFLSRADRTTTRCYFDIDVDPKTQLPRSINMIVLTGVKGATSEADKGKKSFDEGIEHVAFHFDYTIDTNREVAKFQIPRKAAKLMK